MIADNKMAERIAAQLRDDLPFSFMSITFGVDESNPYVEINVDSDTIGTAVFRAIAHLMGTYPNVRVIGWENASNSKFTITIW